MRGALATARAIAHVAVRHLKARRAVGQAIAQPQVIQQFHARRRTFAAAEAAYHLRQDDIFDG